MTTMRPVLQPDAAGLAARSAAPPADGSRRIRRPLRLLLPAAIALPLAVAAASAWIAWRQAWQGAEAELVRAAEAGAEYARGLFDAHRVASDRVNDLLRGLSDAEVRAGEAELHGRLRGMLDQTPRLRAIYVGDRDGRLLVGANIFPVPREVDFSDREWHAALAAADAPEVFVSRIYVPRVQARNPAFFSLARRRVGAANGRPPGEFDGQVNVSFYPDEVGAGLERLLPAGPSSDRLGLIRSDGEVLALAGQSVWPVPPLAADSALRPPLATGVERVLLTGRSLDGDDQRLVALRRVPGYPVYASASRTHRAILARWRQAIALPLAIGGSATLLLLGLALVVRRTQRDLAAANAALETRVAERTAELELRTRQLAESEAAARSAFEELSTVYATAPIGLSVMDGKGRYLRINDRLAEINGLPAEAHLGRTIREIAPDIAEVAEALDRHVIETGEPLLGIEVESPREVRPGVRRSWVSSRLPLRDASGRVVAVNLVAMEVTERRAAERALAESEARYRALVEVSPQVVWTADAEGRLSFASTAWWTYTGQDAASAIGSHAWLEAVHPEDRDRMVRTWEAAQAEARAGGPGLYEVEFRLRGAADGAHRWFLSRATPERTEDGRVLRWRGVALDIHDRRAAETALRESEERLRLAQEAGGIGSWDWDVESNALHWSESCHRLHGTDPTQPPSFEAWRQRIHPEDWPQVEAALRSALEGHGNDWRIEFRFRRVSDGELRWVLGHGSILRDPASGKARRVLGIATDVTERRLAEERQTLLTRELDHRAKNALAVVQAALRLTPRDDAAMFASAVEGRVSALARAHALFASQSWQGAALRPLVAAELAVFDPAASEARGGRVVIDGPEVMLVPSAAQPLAMALHELATNATKYGALSAASGRLRVSWRVDEADGLLRLDWVETGGPRLGAPPARRGFGSRVIEATIRNQVGGRVEMAWPEEGLRCRIEVPLPRVLAGAEAERMDALHGTADGNGSSGM